MVTTEHEAQRGALLRMVALGLHRLHTMETVAQATASLCQNRTKSIREPQNFSRDSELCLPTGHLHFYINISSSLPSFRSRATLFPQLLKPRAWQLDLAFPSQALSNPTKACQAYLWTPPKPCPPRCTVNQATISSPGHLQPRSKLSSCCLSHFQSTLLFKTKNPKWAFKL